MTIKTPDRDGRDRVSDQCDTTDPGSTLHAGNHFVPPPFLDAWVKVRRGRKEMLDCSVKLAVRPHYTASYGLFSRIAFLTKKMKLPVLRGTGG
jgi:hypothetical protein